MTAYTTTDRVPAHTAVWINRRIARDTRLRAEYYREHPDDIPARLHELDAEWDIERALEANAAGVILVSVLLGIVVSRKWLLFPAVVAGFLLQHAIEGWCPPLPLLRRLGVRTQSEIEAERCALKALRPG